MVVGTGAISAKHVDGCRAAGVEVVGAVDIDGARAEAFAREHGIDRYETDFERAMAELEPDAVHLCTPPAYHAELSVAALRAGAWVLSEKPVCGSLEELDGIQATVRESGNYCAVVLQWRFGSGMRHVRSLLEERAMGRPLVGVCNTLWYRDDSYYAVPWRGKWATEFGGPTVGLGVHAMDAFLWLMGEWTEVTAKAETLARHIEVEDVSAAIVRFRNGAIATMMNSALSPRQETYLRLDCEFGTAEASGLYWVGNEQWRFTAAPCAPEGAAEAWAEFPGDAPGTHRPTIASFYDDLTAGRAPSTSGTEARRAIEFISALYKSAVTGRAVGPGEIQPGDEFYRSMSGRG